MKKLYTLLLMSVFALGMANAQDLFFSEYIEGAGGSKKALEIYNPTGDAVDLGAYRVAYASNGNGWSLYHIFPDATSLADDDVWVMVADEDYTGFFDIAEADEVLSYPSVVHFNGDDAVALLHITGTGDDADTTLIDVIGTPDSDPGSGWDVAGVDNATANHTLVRKNHIVVGNTDWTAAAGTDASDSEWNVNEQNFFDSLGVHTYIPLTTAIILTGEGAATTITSDKASLQINAEVQPAEAVMPLLWSVNDPSLAIITQDGLVTAINDGVFTVTAAAQDGTGITGTIDITNSNQTPVVVATSIIVTGAADATTIAVDGGTLQMSAEVLPANATDLTVAWSVNDPSLGSIDANGLLTALSNGTVTVTATSNDGYGATGSLDIDISEQITEVADLTELRTMDLSNSSMVYKVTGKVLVTYTQTYRNKKYVQDAGAGIEIDDNSGLITTTYNVGDSIAGLTGTIGEYNKMLQFTPVADPGAAISTGNAVVPIVLTPGELITDHDLYESRLVVLENVTFNDANDTVTFENGNSYELKDATDTLDCAINFYTDLEGVVIPDSANVTGIALEKSGTIQISPRLAADLVELFPYVPSDDATITDLLIDGTSVTGFTPAQLSYDVVLQHSTTAVPAVTAVTSNDSAKVTVTDATDLAGDEAARTTTVLITAEDGVATKTYTVVFRLNVGVENLNGASMEIYPVPAKDQLFVRSAESLTELRVISITGSTLKVVELSGEKSTQLNISDLEYGVYFLKLSGESDSQILRFVKN